MAYRVHVRWNRTAASRLRNLDPRQTAQAVIEVRQGCPDGRVDVTRRGGEGR
jgi:hypothetical protein